MKSIIVLMLIPALALADADLSTAPEELPEDVPLAVPVNSAIVNVGEAPNVRVLYGGQGMYLNAAGVVKLEAAVAQISADKASAEAERDSLKKSMDEISKTPNISPWLLVVVSAVAVAAGVGATAYVRNQQK